MNNKIFNKIFVINLDKDKKRLQQITTYINDIESTNKIEMVRISGILSNRLTKEELNKYTNIITRNFILSDSILGCALSHLKVYNYILNNYPYINNDYWFMISEDDSIIPKDIMKQINKLIDKLNKSGEIEKYDIINLSYTVKDLQLLEKFINKNINPGFNFYLIKKPTMIKILNHYNKYSVYYHIDIVSSQLLNIYYPDDIRIKQEYSSNTHNTINSYPQLPIFIANKTNVDSERIFLMSQTVFALFNNKVNYTIIYYILLLSILFYYNRQIGLYILILLIIFELILKYKVK